MEPKNRSSWYITIPRGSENGCGLLHHFFWWWGYGGHYIASSKPWSSVLLFWVVVVVVFLLPCFFLWFAPPCRVWVGHHRKSYDDRDTPWKLNGWNLQITNSGKEKIIDLPNLHEHHVPAVNLQNFVLPFWKSHHLSELNETMELFV